MTKDEGIRMINESSREEMYEQTKREFLQNNGIQNGDTTKRGDVYNNLYKKVSMKDRLAAGNTLQQYETAYRQAFIATVKAADPEWKLGKPFSADLLDNVSREDIEKSLHNNGKNLVQRFIIKTILPIYRKEQVNGFTMRYAQGGQWICQ